MNRIIISLEKSEKDWLAEIANEQNISMAEVIRRAIGTYKVSLAQRDQQVSFEQSLQKTKGISTLGDGQDYINKLRSEWD